MDENLLDILKNEFKLNDKRLLQEYENIDKYKDIHIEFVYTIKNGFTSENPIEVEGYTAKKLFESYDLSILGVYNYLVSLRDNPTLALSFLQKGLIRK